MHPWGEPLAALARDRWLWLAAILHLGLWIQTVVPDSPLRRWVETSERDVLGASWEVLQFGLFFAVVFVGLSSLAARERIYWRFLAAAFGFWLLANSLRFFQPADGGTFFDVVVDSLYLAYYLSLIFAIDTRPDLSRRSPFGDLDRQLNLWGAILFAFALLIYCVHIPSTLEAEVYRRGWLSMLLYLGLDVFLVLRLLYLAVTTHSVRWRMLFASLSFSLVGFTMVDLVEFGRRYRDWTLPDHYGTAWDLLWLVPFPLLLVAVRLRRHLPAETPVALGDDAPHEPLGPLVLYALAFPMLHLLLHYFGAASEASQGPRDYLVIGYFAVLGALSIWQFQHRDASRRSAERKLRDSEDNYRQLVESTGNAIVVECQGEIVYANALAWKLFGLGALPVSRSLTDLGLPAPPPTQDIPQTQAGDDPPTAEADSCTIEGADGETRRLRVTYRWVTYGGKSGWQAIARDVTLLERLREQTRRLERLATLGELASTFGEKIEGPLRQLAEGCRSLEHPPHATDEENAREDLELALGRIERLVDGIRDFSLLAEPQFEVVELEKVIETALRTLRIQCSSPSPTGSSVVFASAPPITTRLEHTRSRVRVDPHQMTRVLVNLLDNAQQASGAEGGVELVTSNDDRTLDLEVVDHGAGIPPQHLDRIFDPFFTTRSGGTGLGLSVVSQILAGHHCLHTVESRPGHGTRFVLSFPLERDEPMLESSA